MSRVLVLGVECLVLSFLSFFLFSIFLYQVRTVNMGELETGGADY